MNDPIEISFKRYEDEIKRLEGEVIQLEKIKNAAKTVVDRYNKHEVTHRIFEAIVTLDKIFGK